ncbi:MAG: hypothetical protein SFZ03_02385 [Candidatus Melainabacteria bacterium]|nr:hypothetical protein [Candidatus Melainabacteria bacterium]
MTQTLTFCYPHIPTSVTACARSVAKQVGPNTHSLYDHLAYSDLTPDTVPYVTLAQQVVRNQIAIQDLSRIVNVMLKQNPDLQKEYGLDIKNA